MPIVNQSKLVGFYLAINLDHSTKIDISLLSIINRQISSLMYRSLTAKKIETTQKFYQEIVDYLSSIIVVLDDQLNIEFKNEKFNSFFDKDYHSFKDIIFDFPSLEIVHKIIDFSDTEMTVKLKDKHFKLSLKKMGASHIIILLTDVTELVRIQHNISKSSKLKGMGTFVAGVAHEIKNPLVAVKTFTQLLAKDWSNIEIQQKCDQIVLPQLNRIKNLAESLNFFGKDSDVSFQPLNFSSLILDTIDLVKQQQQLTQINVDFDIEPNVYIFAYETKMSQVLLNLFLNAVDAVDMAVRPVIKFRLYTDNQTKVVLDIVDNGEGISKKDIPYLFDPFFTTKDKGTGLGLSIVHQIMMDHQGVISIPKFIA